LSRSTSTKNPILPNRVRAKFTYEGAHAQFGLSGRVRVGVAE
jgi:hypothetical protein